jgi:hypothetical protein
VVALVFYETNKHDSPGFAATAAQYATERGAPPPLGVDRYGSVWEAADAYAKRMNVVVDEIHIVSHIYKSSGPAGLKRSPPPVGSSIAPDLRLVLHGCVGRGRYDWKAFFARMPGATAYVHTLRTSAGQPFEFHRLSWQQQHLEDAAVADPVLEDIGITDAGREAWIAAQLRSLASFKGRYLATATANMLGWFGPRVDDAFKHDFATAIIASPKGAFPALRAAAERYLRSAAA